ncbi:MAG: amino acid racemase [Desulfobacterales bacterium]|nr:amino acid racemase [Desulfobacterales bacterium]
MHKKIGIIGGLSPESTVSYYLHITRTYVERYGDYGYPEIIIYSVNLENYHRWRGENRWDRVAGDLIASAKSLEKAGADFGLIATNTMHKVFDAVSAAVDLPLLHIIDATAAKAREMGLKNLGLLGTRFTMSDGFYHEKMAPYGINTIVPCPEDQDIIHDIIVEELVQGRLLEDSRAEYIRVIRELIRLGAEGVILGCTEIPLLVKPEDSSVPLLDTAIIHAGTALNHALRQ